MLHTVPCLLLNCFLLQYHGAYSFIVTKKTLYHAPSSELQYSLSRRGVKLQAASIPSSSDSGSGVGSALPRITPEHIQALTKQNYVVIPNFLSSNLQEELRKDVASLRSGDSNFKVAKIGQDSTNTLNQEIRIAETCFFGSQLPSNNARNKLSSILQQVSRDLSNNPVLQSPILDDNLSELLYAYYPEGGFYRRHRDAIPGSASVLRTFSLLLYLNNEWKESDGGCLRIHFDSGGDECPPNEEPNYVDVQPEGGTLVLFSSDKVPHEVLDTNSERLAVVGWYNRKLSVSDIAELSDGSIDPMRLGLLAVAAALVTVGVANLI